MRNWTISEAVRVLNENTDMEAIKEIVSHFPVFAMAAAKNDLAGVAVLMGDKFKLNRLAKEPIADMEDEQSTDGGSDQSNSKPLEEMTAKELMKLCDARGIKVPHYGKNKQFYLEQLQGAGEAEASEADTKEAEWEDQEQSDPYEGKTAKELHALCKERGIKADIKKPAKFYADLLRKADESDEGESGDWDETEEEKPAKPAKNKKEKDDAKSDDDGDDWDI